MAKPSLTILLASPRGFCAGVDRAIQIVEKALEKFGAPVYVRHEIVHNRTVVEDLERKGAVFVEELDEIPDNQAPVIFSAHGVPKAVPAAAAAREMIYLDATCPLVSKVHREAERHHKEGYQIILIGHAGHPEVIGTMGQLPEGSIILVEDLKDVAAINPSQPDKLAYISQTTLSVDDTASIIEALQARFPTIHSPKKEDICYATTNRQMAVKELASKAEAMVVIGAPNSSNSVRLVEVAQKSGCPKAKLIQHVGEMDWAWLEGSKTLGISAGASAPEVLVEELIAACRERFDVTLEDVHVIDENVTFKLPASLVSNG